MATQPIADAAGLEIYFLDMGREKYGDSILCRRGGEAILIDGGHPEDIKDRGKYLSIPNQLAEIFGHDPPFNLSLLVVTHCHNDHIGCLPEMVAQNIIRPDWALVADYNIGFGVPTDDSSAFDGADVTPAMHRLLAALREEDHSDLPDSELLDFIDWMGKLDDRYTEMLSTLDDRIGARLVRYGVDDDGPLRRRFSRFGLKILGPSEEHLLICAEEIRERVSDMAADLHQVLTDGVFGDANAFNEAAAYRAMASSPLPGAPSEDAGSSSRPGYALNDQSIVLQIKTRGVNVLLTGDMQFADSGIDELAPFMDALRAKIAAQAPFDLVKIAHHASHNAFNEDVMDEMGATRRYVISGGIKDKKHPHPEVLKLLRRERSDRQLQWARTDKNGMITATFGRQGKLDISRGRINSATPNVFDAPLAAPLVPLAPIAPPAPMAPHAIASPEPPRSEVRPADVVRVITEVPHVTTQVTVAINVQPGKPVVNPEGDGEDPPPPPPPPPGEIRLGGGRKLPPLLFVTSQEALARNVGSDAAECALRAVRAAGQLLIDSLPAGATSPNQVLDRVRPTLNSRRDLRGVVILGGYDVVPASRLDAIEPALRTALGPVQEHDDFIVWSDAIYGDFDGDGMGELPVSRIPDGRSAELLLTALQAGKAPPTRRAGVRNVNRPFAKRVFSGIKFDQHLEELSSAPISPQSPQFTDGHLQDAAIYLMLHGDFRNPGQFDGEVENSSRICPAINVANIAQARLDKAVVLAGCCWGALTVRERAADVPPDAPVTPLRPEQSMALSFLKQGALAFVGCTGVHYSPPGSEPVHSGGPLHVAFWRNYAAGMAPAEALFNAKTEYIKGIPHDPQPDAMDRAIELKIMREFTCLGLGW